MQVFLIGKDFGAAVVSSFVLFHEKKVVGFVTIGVPFVVGNPLKNHDQLPEGFYVYRWRVCCWFLCVLFLNRLNLFFFLAFWSHFSDFLIQEPGRAEADFGRFDTKTVVRNIYILFSRSEMPIADEKQEIMDMVDSSTPLPHWFTEQDLETYSALYEKSGFRTALKVPYR